MSAAHWLERERPFFNFLFFCSSASVHGNTAAVCALRRGGRAATTGLSGMQTTGQMSGLQIQGDFSFRIDSFRTVEASLGPLGTHLMKHSSSVLRPRTSRRETFEAATAFEAASRNVSEIPEKAECQMRARCCFDATIPLKINKFSIPPKSPAEPLKRSPLAFSRPHSQNCNVHSAAKHEPRKARQCVA